MVQLQILPLSAVDIDTQREVTINGKEGQGAGALMISHEHLGGGQIGYEMRVRVVGGGMKDTCGFFKYKYKYVLGVF